MSKVASDNWRELPIEDWNSRTFMAYLTHLTEEKFGVTYEPRGQGSKTQRWSREMGMINNARKTYGNEVLRKFIRIAIEKYSPKPRFPYMTFAFAYSYMSDLFPVAQAQVAKEERKRKAIEEAKLEGTGEDEDIEDFF